MPKQASLSTGYQLPFCVNYGGERMLSTGGSIHGVIRTVRAVHDNQQAVQRALRLFVNLAATGALAGRHLDPGRSGLFLGEPQLSAGSHLAFDLRECFVDYRAVVVFAHLLLARQEEARVESLQLFQAGERLDELLSCDPAAESTYPELSEALPFDLHDEEPESGGYTFTAELEQPLTKRSAEVLSASLATWVEAVNAGAYALAPIPPLESYAEPAQNNVVSFDTTVDWTVFKVRADPACVSAVINVFAGFHARCQRIERLTVS